MDFLHKVEAIIILNAEGGREFAKYYPVMNLTPAKAVVSATPGSVEVVTSPWATPEKQKSLEEEIFAKSHDGKGNITGSDGDILLHDGHTIVYKVDPDLSYFVIGGGDENEMVLCAVLAALYDSLQQVLKITCSIDHRTLLENYEVLLLIVDELVDDGIILETSASSIVADVAPYVEDSSTDGAKKAISSINKYIKNNL